MSTILVDNLTGKTSAGSITVTSDGGAATQSLQQGLAKSWFNYDNRGTATLLDSHNISSMTDNAAADMTSTVTSAFADINRGHATCAGVVSSDGNYPLNMGLRNQSALSNVVTTTTARYTCLSHNGVANDGDSNSANCHGDLA